MPSPHLPGPLTVLLGREGELDQLALLLLREDAPLAPAVRDLRERFLRGARGLPPPATFARAWEEGRALTLEMAAERFETAVSTEADKNAPLGELKLGAIPMPPAAGTS